MNKQIFFFLPSVQFKRRFWIHFFANQAWFLSLFSKKGHQSQSNEKSFGWKNTFFLRRTFCVCPYVVGKIGFGRYAGVLRGLVFLLDGSLFLSQSVWQDDWPGRLRAYVVCNGLRTGWWLCMQEVSVRREMSDIKDFARHARIVFFRPCVSLYPKMES